MTDTNAQAQALMKDVLVWDMVWPWEPWCANDIASLRRFHTAGVNVVSLTIAGDDHNITQGVTRVAQVRREIEASGDFALFCQSLSEIDAAVAAGRLAVLLHFEGTRCFERNLDMIDSYYRLGVKHTLLAFNQSNSVAGGCMESSDGGLTAFGRSFIKRMAEVGMMLDLSHTGHRSAREAMDLVSKPCVYSHSLVEALFSHGRNLADDEIQACAQTGGAVGLASSSMYHGDHDVAPQTLFEHLDYIVQLVGPEHAVLGLDCIFDTAPLVEWMKGRPEEWPDVTTPGWSGIHTYTPERIVELVACMLEAGYGEAAVTQILGGNYRRICAAVWK